MKLQHETIDDRSPAHPDSLRDRASRAAGGLGRPRRWVPAAVVRLFRALTWWRRKAGAHTNSERDIADHCQLPSETATRREKGRQIEQRWQREQNIDMGWTTAFDPPASMWSRALVEKVCASHPPRARLEFDLLHCTSARVSPWELASADFVCLRLVVCRRVVPCAWGRCRVVQRRSVRSERGRTRQHRHQEDQSASERAHTCLLDTEGR
jgi:hypothetical protein